MTRDVRKLNERRVLEDFLNAAEIRASIVEGEFESPDQIIEFDGRRIGVELTEIQKNAAERAQYELMERVLHDAREQFNAMGVPAQRVTVSFLERKDLRQTNRKELGHNLARVVADRSGGQGVQRIEHEQLPQILRSNIRSISFFGMPGERSFWYPSNATWVAGLGGGALQDRVDAKGLLLPTYNLVGMSEVWLVVHAGPLNPAQRFDAEAGFDPKSIRSPFNRTFFFDYWQCIEVGGS